MNEETNGEEWVPWAQRGGWWRLTVLIPFVLLAVMIWLAFEFAAGLLDGDRLRLAVGTFGLLIINVGGLLLHRKVGER